MSRPPVIEVDLDELAARQIDEGASHHVIAAHWLTTRSANAAARPVGAEDKIWEWCGRTGLWHPRPLESLEVEIGRAYQLKLCRRRTDYAAIARHIYNMTADPRFFDEAPVGLATPAGFYRVDGSAIVCEQLTPEHRQRFAVDIVPDVGAQSPWFNDYLDATFWNAEVEIMREQQTLLQEIIGAIVVGILPGFEKVVLLKGKGGSGKSTLLRIISSLIPAQFVTAVSPFRWSDDYQVAKLAGKRLNLVGELPGDKFIPADSFKTITGRDMVTGRHPYGRPFDFTPNTAHLFNSNHYINTRDHSSAFWRRWLVLLFENAVPLEDQDRHLDRRIIGDELPAVLGWALEGAARVLQRGGFSASRKSDEGIEGWRLKTDAVAEFIRDPEAVVLVPAASTERPAVYAAFRDWCTANERKPMGKPVFYDRLEGLGVRLKRVDGYDYVEGLRLVAGAGGRLLS